MKPTYLFKNHNILRRAFTIQSDSSCAGILDRNLNKCLAHVIVKHGFRAMDIFRAFFSPPSLNCQTNKCTLNTEGHCAVHPLYTPATNRKPISLPKPFIVHAGWRAPGQTCGIKIPQQAYSLPAVSHHRQPSGPDVHMVA